MWITSIFSRVLQSLEFFRSGFGRWFSLLFEKMLQFKIFLIPLLILEVIRLVMSLFGQLCQTIQTSFQSFSTSMSNVGIRGVGGDVLAIANTVLPLDETMGLVVVWFSIYATCALIRFIRAAWAAIPFKAT